MNVICISGRIGRDPELKHTQSGLAVTSFSVAVRRPHTKDTTDWIDVTAWRQAAEYICSYGGKGRLVAIHGILTSRDYTDKQGARRTAFEVVADTVELLDRQNEAPTPAQITAAKEALTPQPTPQPEEAKQMEFIGELDDSDLPF